MSNWTAEAEQTADFALVAIDEKHRRQWLDQQYQKLIESQSDDIIETVRNCQTLNKNAQKLQQNCYDSGTAPN
jgi:UDP-N-acetylglucosamine 2-epimerase